MTYSFLWNNLILQRVAYPSFSWTGTGFYLFEVASSSPKIRWPRAICLAISLDFDRDSWLVLSSGICILLRLGSKIAVWLRRENTGRWCYASFSGIYERVDYRRFEWTLRECVVVEGPERRIGRSSENHQIGLWNWRGGHYCRPRPQLQWFHSIQDLLLLLVGREHDRIIEEVELLVFSCPGLHDGLSHHFFASFAVVAHNESKTREYFFLLVF